jgi:long-chain acyl-CoA synthetase
MWSDLKGEFPILTLPEMFESGLRQARPKPFLGHRELISTDPVTYASEYTWQTYADVDKRRRAVGSALENLFRTGELAAGQDFETVGIWSINRPGMRILYRH